MSFSPAPLTFLVAGLFTALTACSVGGVDDPSSESPSCSARKSRADALFQPLDDVAQSNLSCATDDDCTTAAPVIECDTGCGGVTSVAAAASLAATVNQIDSDPSLCRDFIAECPELVPAISCPEIGGAVCSAGVCTSGIPAAWTSFAVSHQIGPTTTDPFPACDTDDGCGEWDASVVGGLTVTLSGVSHTATLSASDRATVDAIIRRTATTDPSTVCAPYAPSVITESYSLSVSRNAADVASSITGCILGGPSVPTNDMSTLLGILTRY